MPRTGAGETAELRVTSVGTAHEALSAAGIAVDHGQLDPPGMSRPPREHVGDWPRALQRPRSWACGPSASALALHAELRAFAFDRAWPLRTSPTPSRALRSKRQSR